MNYLIEINRDNNFILISVSGEITREKAFLMNQEALKLGKENGINKYLADVTEARNADTYFNNFRIINTDMDNEMISRNTRVAFLAHPEDLSHDFFIIALRNAGFIVQLFRNKEEALEFLAE